MTLTPALERAHSASSTPPQPPQGPRTINLHSLIPNQQRKILPLELSHPYLL